MSDSEVQDLCDLLTKTENALRQNFSNGSFTAPSPLEPKLQALQDAIKLHEIFSTFQKALEKVDKSWLPKGRIEQVVQACIEGRYRQQDLERAFFEHGGINGVLVLYLGTRNLNALFGQICALPVQLREELAARCGDEKLSLVVQAWINSHDQLKSKVQLLDGLNRTDFCIDEYQYQLGEEPPRLDRFAKDKEKAGEVSIVQAPPSKKPRTGTLESSVNF
jgi:hypothetical protein